MVGQTEDPILAPISRFLDGEITIHDANYRLTSHSIEELRTTETITTQLALHAITYKTLYELVSTTGAVHQETENQSRKDFINAVKVGLDENMFSEPNEVQAALSEYHKVCWQLVLFSSSKIESITAFIQQELETRGIFIPLEDLSQTTYVAAFNLIQNFDSGSYPDEKHLEYILFLQLRNEAISDALEMMGISVRQKVAYIDRFYSAREELEKVGHFEDNEVRLLFLLDYLVENSTTFMILDATTPRIELAVELGKILSIKGHKSELIDWETTYRRKVLFATKTFARLQRIIDLVNLENESFIDIIEDLTTLDNVLTGILAKSILHRMKGRPQRTPAADRNLEILLLYFYRPNFTTDDLASHFGITRSRVHQIINDQLRRALRIAGQLGINRLDIEP